MLSCFYNLFDKKIHLVGFEETQLIHFVPDQFKFLYSLSGFSVLSGRLFYFLLALQEDMINQIIFSRIMHNIIYPILRIWKIII